MAGAIMHGQIDDQVTVPISYVDTLLDSLRAQNADVTGLLDSLNITAAELEQSEFSAALYGKVYQRAMWMMQDESFGMLSEGRVPNGALRMMCLCIIHCPTIGAAINRCSEFYDICRGAGVKPVLRTTSRHAVVSIGPTAALSPADFQRSVANSESVTIRTSLSLWHHFTCWLAGRRVALQEVWFSCPKPADASDYEVLFQAPVRFSQPENCLLFDRAVLELPLLQTEESLQGFLKTAPYQLLVMVEGDNSLASQVRAIFGRDFSREMPDADTVAEYLNMSVTTLRRKLQKENCSFQQIKDDCRREAAVTYLSNPDLTNTDIAELLGFDEPSAFFRSFKRWLGITPGEYRRNLLEHGSSKT